MSWKKKIPTPEVQTIRLEPPIYLLDDCFTPLLEGQAWGDLAMWSIDLKESIDECTEDKKALRKFFEEESE